jgi:hypothetical protein
MKFPCQNNCIPKYSKDSIFFHVIFLLCNFFFGWKFQYFYKLHAEIWGFVHPSINLCSNLQIVHKSLLQHLHAFLHWPHVREMQHLSTSHRGNSYKSFKAAIPTVLLATIFFFTSKHKPIETIITVCYSELLKTIQGSHFMSPIQGSHFMLGDGRMSYFYMFAHSHKKGVL